MIKKITDSRMRLAVVPLAVLGLLAVPYAASTAFAQGGAGGGGKGGGGVVVGLPAFPMPNLPNPTPGQLGAPVGDIHGFDDTGFIQAATVDANNSNCPGTTAPARFGGTVTLNHGIVMIPCNLVVQMPANTLTWADFVNGALGVANKGLEIRVIGNVVGPRRIAGLVYVSQQSANSSTGVITGINYTTGDLLVNTGGGPAAVVRINDPNGRFGRAQSPDPRFSVDDVNPTVHAGTGYPMCVPRTNPAVADDPLCPQKNRPNLVPVTVNGAVVAPAAAGCRTFGVAGIVPPASGELSAPVPGQAYCSQYVMKAVASLLPGDPDPRQQAPFEIGDNVTFAGTLVPDAATGTYVSAHTVEASVGIYTQAGTQPSYLAIGEFGVGTIDPNTPLVGVAAAETADRIFLEAETTDVKTPVDIYMMDIDPTTGAIRNRWASPAALTRESNGPLQADGITPIGGGITTQNTGPQPQRARVRTAKAPPLLLSQPTRTMRVAVRSKCVPQEPVNDAAGKAVLTALDTCLNNTAASVANGLVAGEYTAPVFEYIFPENVKPGDGLVPFDLWHLPAIALGEGATTASAVTPGVGPLEPKPW